MKQLVMLLALVACKSDKPPADKPAPKESSKPAAPPSGEMKTNAKDLCKKIDLAPINAAVGVELQRTGGGILVKGGKEPASLSCSYYEKGKMDGGTSFGFIVKAATEFE